jgi:glycosyltransferase involved in cell wall biosynthesis
MRILTVTTSYPRGPGDWAGRFVRDLNAGLVALGHEPRTIAPGCAGAAEIEDDAEAGPVRRVAFDSPPSADLFYGEGVETNARRLGRLRSLRAFLDASRAFQRAICEAAARADLVLAHWVFPSAWWAAGAAGNAPIAGVLHGADARLLARPVAGRIASRRLRGRLLGLVAVSGAAARSVAPRLLVPESRVHVSPMGIDGSTFAPDVGVSRERDLVVAAGRLVPSKGFDVLVRACAGLDARLVVAGEGPDRDRLAREAAAFGVPLDLPGVLAPRALAGLFRRAAVVAAPSRSAPLAEGVPVAVLEALACGAAVVGTRTGGMPDVLPDHALAADDARALRAAILAARAAPERFRDPAAATRFDRVAVARGVLRSIA